MGARGPAAVWIELSSDVPYVSTRPTDSEGRFEFADLAPGRYRMGASDVAPADSLTMRSDRQWAMSEVTLGAADLTDVAMVLTRGASVSGRVVLESVGRAPQGGRTVTYVRLFPAAGSVVIHGLEQLRGAVDAAGRFTIPAVPPGRYYLDLSAPSVWRAKSAMLDGRDVLDTYLDVSSDIENLAITVTDSLTEVSGRSSQRSALADGIYRDRVPGREAAAERAGTSRDGGRLDGRWFRSDLAAGRQVPSRRRRRRRARELVRPAGARSVASERGARDRYRRAAGCAGPAGEVARRAIHTTSNRNIRFRTAITTNGTDDGGSGMSRLIGTSPSGVESPK